MKKIVWLGCAHIHTPHFTEMVKNEPAIEVAGVWDHDVARAEKTAAKFGAPVIQDLSAIWGDASIEAVIICSETNRHAELILPAAQAGKDIYAEKPIGCHADDARKMAAAIEKAGVRFHTGYFRRGMAIDLFLKKLIADGYQPVLAHPERYLYLDMDRYLSMKEAGAQFQRNVGSIEGMYGSAVSRRAKMLESEGLYDMIGTDLHSLNYASFFDSFGFKADNYNT